MGLFRKSRPHVSEMLGEQIDELDRIFGTGAYTVEPIGEYSAMLKTPVADLCFSDDPRDFVAADIVKVPKVDVPQSPTGIWMRFLDQETPLQNRSDTYQVQLANELKWIASIVDRILKDRETTRNAAWFIHGYNQAYNDWASRKGSWLESDIDT